MTTHKFDTLVNGEKRLKSEEQTNAAIWAILGEVYDAAYKEAQENQMSNPVRSSV